MAVGSAQLSTMPVPISVRGSSGFRYVPGLRFDDAPAIDAGRTAVIASRAAINATKRGRRDGARTRGANILGPPPPARDGGTPAGSPRRTLQFRYRGRSASV